LKVGGSNLGFLLTPTGAVLDMVTVTRTKADEFVIVGNDESAAKVSAWLKAVNAGEAQIDTENRSAKVASCELFEASAAYVSGADSKANYVLLSLQGPKAAATLEKAGAGEYARSGGNVGRKDGFELFVPADKAADVWSALIKAGATPTGYEATNRARTIKGIVAMNSEVGGNIDPDSACYGNSVKLWKPFFIGRAGYIKAFEAPRNTIVRFSLPNPGTVPATCSPVFDGGKEVGSVTSIALDAAGQTLTGMAYVPLKYRRRKSKLSLSVNGEMIASPTLTRFGK
ncbi:MAG: hypothetical protein AAF902_24860, partial [Chloroflexota bacterium]